MKKIYLFLAVGLVSITFYFIPVSHADILMEPCTPQDELVINNGGIAFCITAEQKSIEDKQLLITLISTVAILTCISIAILIKIRNIRRKKADNQINFNNNKQ